MKLRALIVDDEPPARNKIRKFLEHRPDIELVGEAGSGVEAIEQILELRPELLFLDIQMPGGDGFDVLREVYPHHKAKVIFITAFDAYAVRAFEVEAVDYLLKPFTADRFHKAVDRAVLGPSQDSALTERVLRLLEEIRSSSGRAQRLLIRGDARMFFLKTAEIEWIEAQEKYVMVHARTEHYLLRQSLTSLESQLAPASFVRIHRCHLINLDALQEIVPWSHGDSVAIMKSGIRLNIGRNYREELVKKIASA